MTALHPDRRAPAAIGSPVVRVVRATAVSVVDGGVRASVVAAGETVGQALAAAGIAVRPGDAVSPAVDTAAGVRARDPHRTRRPLRAGRGRPHARAARAPRRSARRCRPRGSGWPDGTSSTCRPIPPSRPASRSRSPACATSPRPARSRSRTGPRPSRTPIGRWTRSWSSGRGARPGAQQVQVTYHGGRVRARRVLDEVIVREPISEQVSFGTRISWGIVQTEAGPMRYWRKLRVYATSYSAARAGTPKSAPWYGHTRIGEIMRKGIVAVDPRVIPLRTNLYVDGYGLGLAGDTGGGIKRLHIDLGYDDDNYIGWHQYVDVYLLEPAPPPERMPWVLP
ncbi:MAG: 3D domain-containing protein [Anaerolineae bacterium]